ncbi:MAG: alanine racemase [Clostridia bacterium]|nr:alanine racemase [Clostridia bacterium]
MDFWRPYENLPNLESEKTRIEIDSGVLAENYQKLTAKLPGGCVGFSVVKADAYGHTNGICAPALYRAGCRHFAVSSVSEALALRKILHDRKNVTILILGFTPISYAGLLSLENITQCVYSLDYAKALSNAAKGEIRIHLKLNTGMNRLGFDATDPSVLDKTVSELSEVFSLPHLNVTGMFAHFARADEFTKEGDDFTRLQFDRFQAVDNALKEKGLDVKFRHVSNSAAAIRFPEFSMDGVRFGIVLYGGGDKRLTDLADTKPVMRLWTRISYIHTLHPGEGVGYGSTYTAETERTLATMPIGYADGFIRAYKDSIVTVYTKSGEKKVPLVGRICMDQCMADVTGIGAGEGDDVLLFGGDRASLDELAKKANTIDYECICLLSSRIPRVEKE